MPKFNRGAWNGWVHWKFTIVAFAPAGIRRAAGDVITTSGLIGLVALTSCSNRAPSEASLRMAAAPPVPVELKGLWIVRPPRQAPGPFPQDPSLLPELQIRITSSEYVWRFRDTPGTLGGFDGETGEAMIAVEEDDGQKFWEAKPYSIRVNTNTSPWEMDFVITNKSSEVVHLLAICEVTGDNLKLSRGRSGQSRPNSFTEPTDGWSYTVQEATRDRGERESSNH